MLTSWGKVLMTIMSNLDPADDLEEAAYLAVELLRLGHLNAETMFPKYTGSPSGGSGEYTEAQSVFSQGSDVANYGCRRR